MVELAPELREYIASDESMTRVTVLERHPGLAQRLKTPETRRELLAWLETDEAWAPGQAGFTGKVLQFLRDAADPGEAPAIRPFLLHEDAFVRLRAHEFMLTLYFPDRNRDALLAVIQQMLVDPAEPVRAAGVRYLERAGAGPEFTPFLRRWVWQRQQAPSSQPAESVELAERLLAR